ncbi:MAG: tetratricopeptide repeat protein [Planctomycetes bacterium]|nr:tetratricopeptide repeat protein [Planctomycetota bacterium]
MSLRSGPHFFLFTAHLASVLAGCRSADLAPTEGGAPLAVAAGAHTRRGLEAVDLAQFVEAAGHFDRALAAGESGGALYYGLGRARFAAGQTASAEQCFRAALVFEPRSAAVAAWLARCCYVEGRFAEAETLCAEAGAAHPLHRELLLVRGHALVRLDRGDEAVDCFETLRLAGDAPRDALLALGDLYATRGLPDEAARVYQEALASGSPSIDDRLRLAQVMLEAGRADDARPMAQAAAAQDPNRFEAQALLGDILRALGRDAEAAAYYKSAAVLSPAAGGPRIALADIALSKDRLDEAESAFRDALTDPKCRAAAHAGLGDVALRRRRFPEALRHYQRALEIEPARAEYAEMVRALTTRVE